MPTNIRPPSYKRSRWRAKKTIARARRVAAKVHDSQRLPAARKRKSTTNRLHPCSARERILHNGARTRVNTPTFATKIVAFWLMHIPKPVLFAGVSRRHRKSEDHQPSLGVAARIRLSEQPTPRDSYSPLPPTKAPASPQSYRAAGRQLAPFQEMGACLSVFPPTRLSHAVGELALCQAQRTSSTVTSTSTHLRRATCRSR